MEFTKYSSDRKVVDLVVIGAGLRGRTYADLAVASGRGRVVAVAEPDPDRRESFARLYNVESVFENWAQLRAAGRLADAAVITTQDRLHADPAVMAAGLGYHLLLEKPMAPYAGTGATRRSRGRCC